jgi:hypothetical protein
MNGKFITESFALKGTAKNAIRKLCSASGYLEFRENGDGTVYFRGACSHSLDPRRSPEFIALLPSGGVLCYELHYIDDIYYSLYLTRLPFDAAGVCIQSDSYINDVLGMNRRLSKMVSDLPENFTGAIFVTSGIDIKKGMGATLDERCREAEIYLEPALFGHGECVRLFGKICDKFNPFESRQLLDLIPSFSQGWKFYVVKLSHGILNGIDLCSFSPRSMRPGVAPAYGKRERTIMESGSLSGFIRMNEVLDSLSIEYAPDQKYYSVK